LARSRSIRNRFEEELKWKGEEAALENKSEANGKVLMVCISAVVVNPYSHSELGVPRRIRAEALRELSLNRREAVVED
jgi:hypothetical protein